MAMPDCAFHRPLHSPPAQFKQFSGSTCTSEGAWQWTRMAMGCDRNPFLGLALRLQIGGSGDGFCQCPPGVLQVKCASKSAMRVLQEVVSASGTNGAKLLVRRSRGLSRVAQMEVLEELVQRGQCELVIPVSHLLLMMSSSMSSMCFLSVQESYTLDRHLLLLNYVNHDNVERVVLLVVTMCCGACKSFYQFATIYPSTNAE